VHNVLKEVEILAFHKDLLALLNDADLPAIFCDLAE
jgi:hypothetical protein